MPWLGALNPFFFFCPYLSLSLLFSLLIIFALVLRSSKIAIRWVGREAVGQMGHWLEGKTCFLEGVRHCGMVDGYRTAHEGGGDWHGRGNRVYTTPRSTEDSFPPKGDVTRSVSPQLRIDCRWPPRAKVRLRFLFFSFLVFQHRVRTFLFSCLSFFPSTSLVLPLALGIRNSTGWTGWDGLENCG